MMINYAIDGIRDGFASQYLKKIGGFAFCEISPKHKYVHIPFVAMDHVDNKTIAKLNKFIGIPNTSAGKDIQMVAKWHREVFEKPDKFYTSRTMDKIRAYYWSSKKPPECEQEIVVHIRRGDLGKTKKGMWSIHPKRITPNQYYHEYIPNILKKHLQQKIKIHTSVFEDNNTYNVTGEDLLHCHKDYESIFNNWPHEFLERTTLSINEDIMKTFHDMVTCKKLFMARSSMSYAAAIISTNEIFFQNGVANSQTSTPLKFWKNWKFYEE